MTKRFLPGVLTVLFGIWVLPVCAQTFGVGGHPVQVHGFFSQGFMTSDGNNFLTAKTSDGTLSMTDGGFNMVTNINDHLRVGAQAYTRNIGRIGNGHVQLDWGYADYRIKDWLGFRGGKVKSTLGLYNDTQDVDALHTWAILPQSVYPLDLRSQYISHVGGDLYGEVPVPHMGSVSYVVYGGQRPEDPSSGQYYGLADQGYTNIRQTGMNIGYDVRWSTPVKGLRLGHSYLKTDTDLSGNLGKIGLTSQGHFSQKVGYGEYSFKRLKFAGEYRTEDRDTAIQAMGRKQPDRVANLVSYFASVTYRFTKGFQVGTYNSRFEFNANAVPGLAPASNSHIYDQAVTARFDFKQHWTYKVEGHFMDGVASSLSAHGFYLADNPQGLVAKTNLLVMKVGFNF